MRYYPLHRWVAGAKKQECARCGFDFVTTELVFEERTGYMVCPKCYDPQHPQDFKKRKGLGGAGETSGATEGIYSEEN